MLIASSVTASLQAEDQDSYATAVFAYECAADAALMAGNMSYYLACQSRLLGELYTSLEASGSSASRRCEFLGYALLYFGAYHKDRTEVVMLMRRMTRADLEDSDVRFALDILRSVSRTDYLAFRQLYCRASRRQRTLLSEACATMRDTGMLVLARSHRTLNTGVAASWLGIGDPVETRALLVALRPELEPSNRSADLTLSFVKPR